MTFDLKAKRVTFHSSSLARLAAFNTLMTISRGECFESLMVNYEVARRPEEHGENFFPRKISFVLKAHANRAKCRPRMGNATFGFTRVMEFSIINLIIRYDILACSLLSMYTE